LAGELSLAHGVAEVQAALAKLPDVANARERLLGLQMGVAASAEELAEAASSSDGGGRGDWLPAVGEAVLVRVSALYACPPPPSPRPPRFAR
jgi:citrate lyase beta subunit